MPEGFACVASGRLRSATEVTLRDLLTLTDGKAYVFTAADPLRYLAVVVSRFVRVADSHDRPAPTATDAGAPQPPIARSRWKRTRGSRGADAR